MADLNALLDFEPSSDLLRAPVLTNQHLDLPPYGAAEAGTDLGRPPCQGQAVSLFGAVAPQPTVAPQFPTDRRLVAVQHLGNLVLLVTGLLQYVDLVSFLSGELRVRPHQCSFDFVV